jgi:hypothetical protein
MSAETRPNKRDTSRRRRRLEGQQRRYCDPLIPVSLNGDQVNGREEWQCVPTPDISKASPLGAFPLAREVSPLFHDTFDRRTARRPIQEKSKAAGSPPGRGPRAPKGVEERLARPFQVWCADDDLAREERWAGVKNTCMRLAAQSNHIEQNTHPVEIILHKYRIGVTR